MPKRIVPFKDMKIKKVKPQAKTESTEALYPDKLYQDKITKRNNEYQRELCEKRVPREKTLAGFLKTETRSFLNMADLDMDSKVEKWLSEHGMDDANRNPEKSAIQAIIGCIACMAQVEKLFELIPDVPLKGAGLAWELERAKGMLFLHSCDVITCLGTTLDVDREILKNLAKHANKFLNSSGRKPDKFTNLLEAIVTNYYQQNSSFPDYMTVLRILKKQKGNNFIHTVDDDGTIEWGEKGNTLLNTLKNKLSSIRKKIKK